MKYLTLILTILFLSCEQDLDQPLPGFEEKLVVTSFIRPDTTITVFLTNNVSVLSTESPESITGANIYLYEDDILIGQLDETTFEPDELDSHIDPFEGVYILDYYPQVGKTYRIEVSGTDYDDVMATTTIPEQTSQFSATLSAPRIILREEDNNGSVGYRYVYTVVEYDATIKIKDAAASNYYAAAILNENPVSCSHKKSLYEVDFDSNNIIFEGGQSTGFEEDGGKVFSDDLFNNQEFEFQITFQVWGSINEICEGEGAEYFDKFYIQMRSVSEEYYQYIFTTTLQKAVLEDPFAEPVQIFNNIEGGLGIFAGYNFEMIEFSLADILDGDG